MVSYHDKIVNSFKILDFTTWCYLFKKTIMYQKTPIYMTNNFSLP